MIPFVRDFEFQYGRYDQLTPLIGRVIAKNPGPFTFTGTGTYIVGSSSPGSGVAVIDPGPDDKDHLTALLRSVHDRQVTHILVTHTHRDHSPLAHPFAEATGAAIYAARPPEHFTHPSGNIDEEDEILFRPSVVLKDGDVLIGDGWTLEAVFTPGHASNHMAFSLIEENALFCGDHVMGWSTTVVAPPDGDMSDYMASLEKVVARRYATLWPTHGAPITDPGPFLDAYRDHRIEREAQLLGLLHTGPSTIKRMVSVMYADTVKSLWPAAGLSVHAHLIKLVRDERVIADPGPPLITIYKLAQEIDLRDP